MLVGAVSVIVKLHEGSFAGVWAGPDPAWLVSADLDMFILHTSLTMPRPPPSSSSARWAPIMMTAPLYQILTWNNDCTLGDAGIH